MRLFGTLVAVGLIMVGGVMLTRAYQEVNAPMPVIRFAEPVAPGDNIILIPAQKINGPDVSLTTNLSLLDRESLRHLNRDMGVPPDTSWVAHRIGGASGSRLTMPRY